jgi:hypothetical protein
MPPGTDPRKTLNHSIFAGAFLAKALLELVLAISTLLSTA